MLSIVCVKFDLYVAHLVTKFEDLSDVDIDSENIMEYNGWKRNAVYWCHKELISDRFRPFKT